MATHESDGVSGPAGTAAVEGGALAYWFDIAPQVRAEWLDWYQHDHMPSRVGTTFSTGRCYEAIEARRSHMVLFETATADALLAPAYLGLLKIVGPEDRERRGWYTDTIRVTCRVRARRGRGVGGVLGVVRIAGAPADRADRAELARCLLHDVVPTLARRPRIGAVSLIEYDPTIRERMDRVRLTGHQDGQADWAVLLEAGHDADLASALAGVGELASWRALALGDCAAFERYRLLHAMS